MPPKKEKGPSKLQQFPVRGRCQALHRFRFRGCSTAQTCWSLFPLLLVELNSVRQCQAVARTWVPAVVVLGSLCRRTALLSCDGDLGWGALSALLCPITVLHLHSLLCFVALCAVPGDIELSPVAHTSLALS